MKLRSYRLCEATLVAEAISTI